MSKSKQRLYIGFGVLGFLAIALIAKILINFNATKPKEKKSAEGVEIQIGSDFVEQEKLWREQFDQKLKEMTEFMKKQEERVSLSVKSTLIEELKANKAEVESLKAQLEFSKNEMRNMLTKPKPEELSSAPKKSNFAVFPLPGDKEKSTLPKDISIYIPATTFAPGVLGSGISVSTSVSTQSSPMPIIITINDFAQLPQNFESNLKDCRVLGSCYGELSSERVVVRLESLVCVDKKTRRSIETKVAGFVTGSDGIAGIRGIIVSMDTKHIKNAAIGGFLSGFSKTLRGEGQISLNTASGVITQKQNFKDKFKDNTLEGFGSSGERIADYYIKRAESISPVLQVPPGVEVNVVFTEGVYFGQLNTREIIKKEQGV
jgi:conjugal transfer pilus assembly protein TraB